MPANLRSRTEFQLRNCGYLYVFEANSGLEQEETWEEEKGLRQQMSFGHVSA
jgi:hypothetical protein